MKRRFAITTCFRRTYRAFTLVEVMVTVALLGIALGLLLVPVMNSLGYFRSATARADAQNAARLALDSIARELTEAMYVQLDMYDSSEIAFFAPLRVDPEDPTSEIVTPPRPDWGRAIRYWRGLYDPTANYDPRALFGPGNTFFVARGLVPGPFTYDDEWNRWNEAWADEMNAASEQGIGNWAPVPRVVQTDLGLTFGRAGGVSGIGLRNRTLQPGFPYLYVQSLLAKNEVTQTQAGRLYRDYVVALTPAVLDYDVTELQFYPTTVAGEWLRPVESAGVKDYSVYRSRYPLWRLGAPYTGWAQLSDDPYVHQALAELTWARDPFLLIYRYIPDASTYELRAIGAFDPRSRTMKILDPQTRAELYDTSLYPYRPTEAAFAFGVDWIDGSLRCDFPPPGGQTAMENDQPLEFAGSDLQLGADGTVYERWLMQVWADRSEGADLSVLLAPESIRVRIDTDGDAVPDRTLTQVYGVPRENSDEFQVGLDLPDNTGTSGELRYGWLRVPQYLAGNTDPTVCTFYADFRWRNNGVVPAGGALADEKPDLISAYYRTAAVIDVSITVTRADVSATAGKRVAQSAHLTRRVKLRNLLREIRYEQ
jgi:prepilin-type N-terminal cleavage/methylation domain-containing protein